jgi:hypothetical protein
MLNKLLVGLVSCMLATPVVWAATPLAVVGKSNKVGCIDTQGKIVVPVAYKDIVINGASAGDIVVVQQGSKYGVFDKQGKELVAPVLEKITPVGDNVFAGKGKKTWDFYSTQGQKLFGGYDDVGVFADGLAPVKQNNLWGFVDKTGKLLVPCRYKEVHNFSDGKAAVKRDKYWGYINTTGKELGLANIKQAGDFSQGLAIVDGSWIMNTDGKRIRKLRNYSYVGQFDKNGLAPVGVRYRSASFLDYLSIGWGWGWGGDHGWGWGVDGPGYGGWGWGMGGSFGGHHHHHHYDDSYWGGYIGISPGMFMPRNMKRGYINKDGREVIPTGYDYVGEFIGEYALVRSEGRWGMVDTHGETLIPFVYDKLTPFSDGLAAFEFDDKWGYIDEGNNMVISNRFTQATPFNEGLAAVVEQGKGGIIDKTGKFVFPPLAKYEELGPLQAGLAPFKNNGKWGYVNAKGTIAIPAQYEEAGPFQN